MEKQYVALSNGEKLAFLSGGSGKKVLLALHGNMASSVYMKYFLENVPEDYRVIAPDLRGFGDSSYNRPIGYIKDFAADIADFCRILGVEKAAAVGWSLGGAVAMELSLLCPQLVEKLILVSSASVMGYPLYKKNGRDELCPYLDKEEMYFNAAVQGNVNALKGGDKNYFRAAYDMVIYTVNKPTEAEYALQLEDCMKQRNLLDVDWALCRFNISGESNLYGAGCDKAKNISCPVMLTFSDKDNIVPEFMFKQNAAAFPNAEIHCYSPAGHAPFLDKPQEFYRDMAAFLRS